MLLADADDRERLTAALEAMAVELPAPKEKR